MTITLTNKRLTLTLPSKGNVKFRTFTPGLATTQPDGSITFDLIDVTCHDAPGISVSIEVGPEICIDLQRLLKEFKNV